MTETYHPKGLVRALENVPRRGVASIILSGLLLTAHDAAVKSVSETVPLGELIGVRGAMATLLLALQIVWRYGWREGRIVHVRGNLARAVLMITSTFLFISGLRLCKRDDVQWSKTEERRTRIARGACGPGGGPKSANASGNLRDCNR